MAYKNSGAMKFNDATDLVIRADPDGTVESVYNLADSTEYIDEYSGLPTATLTIVNGVATSRYVYVPVVENGIIKVKRNTIPASDTVSFTMLNHTGGFTTTAVTWEVTSGDAEVDGLDLMVNGDATITITA